MMAFIIHIVILINTLLSVIDNIVIGGLSTLFVIDQDILYSILFFLIFNPIVLFLFYRCNFIVHSVRSYRFVQVEVETQSLHLHSAFGYHN